MSSAQSIPILIVGAGQAGLSVAYHLVKRGREPGKDFRVLDAGPTSGGAWQHRWDSLRFGDAHALADLPGMADAGVTFAHAPTEIPASKVVRSRYAAFEAHYGLQVERPKDVARLERLRDGSLRALTTHGEEFHAQVVVVATGTWRTPRQPTAPGTDIFAGRQLTTPEFTRPEDFAQQAVAVVGGGASAVGFVRELAPVVTSLRWFTRRPVEFLEVDSTPAREFGRESVRLQDAAARAGRPLPSIVSTTGTPMTAHLRRMKRDGLLVREPMFTRLVTDGAVLADGTFIHLDTVIWALGFEADLRLMEPLGVSASHGIQVERGHAVASPGVFLAGYGPQASTISANRGARAIARDAVRYLDDAAWPPPPPPVRASAPSTASTH